jgi:hypothetical protein
MARLTPEWRTRIVELYVGPPTMPMLQVALEVPFSEPTVRRVLKEAGVTRKASMVPGTSPLNRANQKTTRASQVQEGRIVRPSVARYYR